MKNPNSKFDIATAEAIAISGLGFIGQDGERLGKFLNATGVNPADLRELAGSSEFLASVLDFLAQDESLLLVFTSENSIDPELIKPALMRLSGKQGLVSS